MKCRVLIRAFFHILSSNKKCIKQYKVLMSIKLNYKSVIYKMKKFINYKRVKLIYKIIKELNEKIYQLLLGLSRQASWNDETV